MRDIVEYPVDAVAGIRPEEDIVGKGTGVALYDEGG